MSNVPSPGARQHYALDVCKAFGDLAHGSETLREAPTCFEPLSLRLNSTLSLNPFDGRLPFNLQSITSHGLIANLKKVKETMETGSKPVFSSTSPVASGKNSLVYLVGNWESVKQHMEEFIPSEANQQLLRLVKGQISVEWVFHVEMFEPAFEHINEISSQPVVAFDRRGFKLENDELHNIDRAQMAIKYQLKTYIALKEQHMCDWRVNRDAESHIAGYMEEYVVVSGWETANEHLKDCK